MEERIKRLEKLVYAIISKISMDKAYTDADIAGTIKSVNDITPYKETKQAYYGESEKTFYDAPEGNTSVFFDNYNGSYSVSRVQNRLVVSFYTLTEATSITISIQ